MIQRLFGHNSQVIPKSHERAKVADVFANVDVFEFVLSSCDLLLDVITIRACGHSVDLDHVLILIMICIYISIPLQ